MRLFFNVFKCSSGKKTDENIQILIAIGQLCFGIFLNLFSKAKRNMR